MRNMRSLPAGASVTIVLDQDDEYASGETATVVRQPACNAKHIKIRTADGKQWHWPVAYLTTGKNDEEIPF